MAPAYDELNFLNTLCKALKKSLSTISVSRCTMNVRLANAQKRSLESGEQSNRQKLEEIRKEIIAGRGPLAEIRKILRMPNTSRTEA